MTTPYDQLVLTVANSYNLPFDLLQGQMLVESSGDPFAFRYEHDFFVTYIRGNAHAAGARFGPLAACSFGLLQILLETACELGFADRPERLFEPQVGLAFGAKYVRQCIDRSNGDLRLGLARYNGSGAAALAYADRVFVRAGRGLNT